MGCTVILYHSYGHIDIILFAEDRGGGGRGGGGGEGEGIVHMDCVRDIIPAIQGGGYRRGLSGFPSHVPSKGFFPGVGRGAKSFSHGTEYSEVGTDGRTDGQMEGRMDGGGVDWRGGLL